ncbi:hypothetical protein WOLCODRAFT_24308 [Wolfiporia cocos MD-104 SS10]|uniref:Uncharacterized protein n=1 Tax=Wolfiporia cocos (strain MD-104) TaxID=742152 RepID=A0A2H3JF24_WOLCO|nr:hypothetical protein WOLCODRAFT_24308 [Wolfiporia cocos MD-104 SS10]
MTSVGDLTCINAYRRRWIAFMFGSRIAITVPTGSRRPRPATEAFDAVGKLSSNNTNVFPSVSSASVCSTIDRQGEEMVRHSMYRPR